MSPVNVTSKIVHHLFVGKCSVIAARSNEEVQVIFGRLLIHWQHFVLQLQSANPNWELSFDHDCKLLMWPNLVSEIPWKFGFLLMPRSRRKIQLRWRNWEPRDKKDYKKIKQHSSSSEERHIYIELPATVCGSLWDLDDACGWAHKTPDHPSNYKDATAAVNFLCHVEQYQLKKSDNLWKCKCIVFISMNANKTECLNGQLSMTCGQQLIIKRFSLLSRVCKRKLRNPSLPLTPGHVFFSGLLPQEFSPWKFVCLTLCNVFQ